jgi:acyl-CoA dehydrogenase
MRRDHLRWPFFDDAHRALAVAADAWAAARVAQTPDHGDVDAACRGWVRALGEEGFLRYCVPEAQGGALPALDSRSLCVLRETLAYHASLADFAFAMQGLGSGPITLAGVPPQHAHWLAKVAQGKAIAAFALSEPDAGSDVAALATRAEATGDAFVLNGCKTWISNGGIADFYCIFARTDAQMGPRGISGFVVPADTPGLTVAQRIEVMAPHPLARLDLVDCRVPSSALLPPRGGGFKLALATLDVFRASVGAAAVGFARRALDLAVTHVRTRRMFGGTLADLDLTRAALGRMAAQIDAAALLVYRAAWLRDVEGVRTTSEAAMAKMTATEHAQQVIDAALQMHGGAGMVSGTGVERLYREIRALRIYEGATEVQQLIIGRAVLDAAADANSEVRS